MTKAEQDQRMSAEVRTYGGSIAADGYRIVHHWQLCVNGCCIADTSIPSRGRLFEEIAERLSYDQS